METLLGNGSKPIVIDGKTYNVKSPGLGTLAKFLEWYKQKPLRLLNEMAKESDLPKDLYSQLFREKLSAIESDKRTIEDIFGGGSEKDDTQAEDDIKVNAFLSDLNSVVKLIYMTLSNPTLGNDITLSEIENLKGDDLISLFECIYSDEINISTEKKTEEKAS